MARQKEPNAFPKIEIRVDGAKARIFSDGKEIQGVRGYELSHYAGGIAELKLDLMATDLTISGNILPELPDVYKPFYVRREETVQPEEKEGEDG